MHRRALTGAPMRLVVVSLLVGACSRPAPELPRGSLPSIRTVSGLAAEPAPIAGPLASEATCRAACGRVVIGSVHGEREALEALVPGLAPPLDAGLRGAAEAVSARCVTRCQSEVSETVAACVAMPGPIERCVTR